MKSLYALCATATFLHCLALPGVTAENNVTASGLKYTITQPGEGSVAQANQYIVFYCVGKLPDGSVFFDSHIGGEPSTYQVGIRSNQPIGLTEALTLLPVGAKAALTLRPDLAYGDKGMPRFKIEPNTTLTYEVEIVGIKSKRLGDILWEKYSAGGIAAARAAFAELKSRDFPDAVTWSQQLNYLGYGLLYQLNRFDDAIEMFKMNCELYPKNADIRDSLAEAYFVVGDRARAQTELEAVLAMNPKVKSSETMLSQLKASPDSPTRLEQLQKLVRGAGAFGSPPFDKLSPNFDFLHAQLERLLASTKLEQESDTAKQVEAFLMLLQREKTPPANAEAIWAKYAAASDQSIKDAVQRAKEAPEKARLAREAAKKAKEDMQKNAVAIKFTALDGREVDTTQLKGKVVLIDFWATWCGPCIEEIPNGVAAYDKYHSQGFEIVGISLDRANMGPQVTEFTKKNKMPWPQHYDGKYWQTPLAKEYGVDGIPAMLLLDQNGMIVSTNARGPKLEQEVRRLLGLPSEQIGISK